MRSWILAAAMLLAGADGVHPYVGTVERFRAARDANDVEALRTLLSEDSRIWFGEKNGEGIPRALDGGGPWSEWDTLFRSESTILDTRVEEQSLRTTVSEINDWYRLIERPAKTYFITYYFDDEGRIEGTLIHSIDGDALVPGDRLDEFVAWANTAEPELVDTLIPNGDIDPARAALWKEKLLQWRAEAGLPNPLEP